MKRYFDYFKIILIFLQKKGKSFGSHSYPMVLIQERVVRGISQKDKWPLYNFEMYERPHVQLCKRKSRNSLNLTFNLDTLCRTSI